MSWWVILFWCFVTLFCIHIALQIYYANRVSRVDQIKIQMARLEPVPYLPTRRTDHPPPIGETLYTAITEFVGEIDRGIRWLGQVILSIVSPKLYAFIG